MSLKSKKDLNALNARKQKVITTGTGHPARSEGHTGDIVIRRIPKKGLHLFVKYGQKWYSIPLEEKTDSKYDRDRIIAKPRRPKESPYNHEIAALGDDIIVKIDESNTHTLGKSATKITRAVNDGNPTWQMGASDSDCFMIRAVYDSGAKGLDYVEMKTLAGAGLHKGKINMAVDEVTILELDDTGVDVTGTLSVSTSITATSGIYGNGGLMRLTADTGTDCYIMLRADNHEDAGDSWKINVADGGVLTLMNDIASADSFVNHVEFVPHATVASSIVNFLGSISIAASAGFSRQEATFSATTVIGSGGTDDTDIDFRKSNKYRLEMTGDITNVNLIFPSVSGNFLLVCTTNGDHDVTNWKVYENDESEATTTDVMWPGGTVPVFTNNGVDIVSFYWDATEQQAYGTATVDFDTP